MTTASRLVIEVDRSIKPDALGVALEGLFIDVRAGLLEGSAVTLLLGDDALLGHTDPWSAALATAALGMVRALALEGARDGWRINAVSFLGDAGPEVSAAATMLETSSLTGQLLRIGTEHLGKVLP